MVFATDVKIKKSESQVMKVVHLRWRCVLFVGSIASVVFLLYYTVHQPKYPYNCQGHYWEEKRLKHLDRYCNPLNIPVAGAEGLDDEKYELKSVHALIRHGDRYHLHSLQNYENQRMSCRISKTLKEMVPQMKGYHDTMDDLASNGGRTNKQTFHAYNLYPNQDNCEFGHLTPEGAAQHVRNGMFLKKAYEEHGKLLDERLIWDQIMVRSTTKSRTFQSALAFLYGFLPKLSLDKLQLEEALNNSMCTEKSGLPCSCPAIHDMIDAFSCNYQQRSPHVMAQPNVREAYSQIADVFGVASNNLPPLSHIMDIFMVHFCHKQLLPNRNGQCVQPWTMGNVFDAANENGKIQVTNSKLQQVVRLKLQPLLYEIAHQMSDQLNGKSDLRFVLYSGHDSTIEPFATAMGFSPGVWSRYAARIVLELYTDTIKPKPKAYLRVLFDGEVVTDSVVFCKDDIVDSKLGLCPFENFLSHVDGNNFKDTLKKYKEACEQVIAF